MQRTVEFQYHIHPSYLEVVVTGSFSLGDSKGCIDEVYRLCGLHSLRKILIDGRDVPEEITVGARFSLADYLTAGSPQSIRIAMVAKPERIAFSKTFENTANNRGAQVITTDTREAALVFLGILEEGEL